MTKKTIALLLAALMILTLGACSKNVASSTTNANYEGSLEDLMSAIYEINPVELKLGPTTTIDLGNADNLIYFLGLSDAEGIKEAVSSEPMMGSQAYSISLVRVEEGADIDTLKQNILDGINPRKWICVGADKVIVTNYGDIIAMIMTDSNLSATLTDDLYNAFAEAVGGETGKKLERAAE
ncbi:hypothetical protein [Acidaminobacter hydrogenoformans]|uniref:Uncharacterized protein n=1 Tax=Acidaminobacter hydrogenoformans DSM 2784 TaxID=1120920 RepID=A0A1G5S439_9FIRM|nr:hypothetical protein [Acidaminobacter hydrogenoformans]SCZ81135.1 hypothetical protein SAMN03080599_02625 [Acidaminobacter hydrogenoformans DSM 2784]